MRGNLKIKNSTATSHDDHAQVLKLAREAVESGALNRVAMMSFILALAHFIYGFASYTFIHHFRPTVSLWDNVWPRILFSIVPFLCLGWFLKKSTTSVHKKILVYIWIYSILFFVAAWIHVWPIALAGNPEIFLYVNGINSAYLCATWTVVALPRRWLMHSALSVALFIIVPIMVIVFQGGVQHIFMAVINDVVSAAFLGLSLGYMASRVYTQIEQLRATQRVASSKFIEEPLQRAIFENDSNITATTECSAYIFVIDIRDSTVLTRKYKEKWDEFTSTWLAEAIDIIRKHSGTFIKSTGDGMLAAFGLFEEEATLSDIPGLEQADKKADEIRWINLTIDVFGCISELINRFNKIAGEKFPDENIRMGCGLDRGKVMRGIRGGRRRSEFDIWGDKVNTAAKLETFSKSVTSHFEQTASLLVVSPYAADFLDNLESFQKFTLDHSIGGSLNGINWVLVRAYSSGKAKLRSVA